MFSTESAEVHSSFTELYHGKIQFGGRSYSLTTDNSLDFYTNKTEQHVQHKLIGP